ncbi:MAG: MraZ N-terminal domain-containing protein [Thermoplasmatota archaeon]
MATTLHFDTRGRLTIPARLRRHLGTHVVAIPTPKGIELYTAPEHVDLPADAANVTGEDAATAEVDG